MSSNFLVMMCSLSQAISIVFLVDVVPLDISIDPLPRSSVFSSNFITALFALPFSGGAFTFTLRVSSSQPAIPSCDDDGITFT